MNKTLMRLVAGALLAATVVLPGCGSSRHHHHNPDGSYSYYRFHGDHTKECSCRNVYHPSSHYYHAHY